MFIDLLLFLLSGYNRGLRIGYRPKTKHLNMKVHLCKLDVYVKIKFTKKNFTKLKQLGDKKNGIWKLF